MNPRVLCSVLLVVSGAALAGCIDYNTPLEVLDQELAEVMTAAPWSLDFPQGCKEGGFIAPSTMQEGDYLVAPWVRKDIREEIPLRFSQGGAGPVSGNWHQGYNCPSVVKDGVVVESFIWGWVGQMIEPPAWDPGGADLQFHLTGFGLMAGDVRDDIFGKTMVDLTETYEASVTPLAGTDYVDIYMRDQTKGTYEGHGPVMKTRDVEERTIRFWWYVPVDGSRSVLSHIHGDDIPNPAMPADAHMMEEAEKMDWHPVYMDMHTGGGAQFLSVEALNPSSHNDEDAHGGATFYLPEVNAVYEHRHLSLTASQVMSDITLPDYYWH